MDRHSQHEIESIMFAVAVWLAITALIAGTVMGVAIGALLWAR